MLYYIVVCYILHFIVLLDDVVLYIVLYILNYITYFIVLCYIVLIITLYFSVW